MSKLYSSDSMDSLTQKNQEGKEVHCKHVQTHRQDDGKQDMTSSAKDMKKICRSMMRSKTWQVWWSKWDLTIELARTDDHSFQEEPITVFFLMLCLKVFHRNVCFICICIGTLQEDPSAHAVDNFSAHMPCRPRSGGSRVIIVYTGSGRGINDRPVTWHAGHNAWQCVHTLATQLHGTG